MLNPSIAGEVLSAALSQGGDFAEIFMEDRLNNALSMRNGVVETISSGRLHGAGVRIFHEKRCIYAYTNDTTRSGLLDCAQKAAAAVRGTRARPADITFSANGGAGSPHGFTHFPADTAHQKRVDVMRAANRATRDQSAEVSTAITRLVDSDQRVFIANSEGLTAEDRRVYTRLFAIAVAGGGAENQTGFHSAGEMRGFELFDSLDAEEMGRLAADQAVRMLHAPFCPAGVMPVIIGNGFGGVVFHEACGHSLEATSVARGQSEFCGKLGQKIASDCVTAIDDGTIPNAWGSLWIDDEGEKTQRKVLIDRGVLSMYMIDKLNGQRMGMPSTGSGRREGYPYAPTSRMTNTYIAAGDDDLDEMIRTMGDGLYAAKMGGGSVDPTTGMFNFAVDEGYLIRDGKIDTPVRGASLIGRGSEILMKIDRVGKKLEHGQGMCGSISGSVPTNVGQPPIRVTGITVGGRETA